MGFDLESYNRERRNDRRISAAIWIFFALAIFANPIYHAILQIL